MTDIMNADCAKDVARPIHGCTDELTSAVAIRLMSAAWRAGYHCGHVDGVAAGSKAAAASIDAVLCAMRPSAESQR